MQRLIGEFEREESYIHPASNATVILGEDKYDGRVTALEAVTKEYVDMNPYEVEKGRYTEFGRPKENTMSFISVVSVLRAARQFVRQNPASM